MSVSGHPRESLDGSRRRRGWVEPALLFVLAFVSRALFPGATFFGTDQVGTLMGGHAVLNGDLFVAGPGIGWSPFHLGPLLNQMAALGLAPRDEFSDVIVFFALLNAATVVGFRATFAQWVPPAAARIAAFVLALHPNSVAVGGAPGASAMVLPASWIFLTGLTSWAKKGDDRGLAATAVGAALLIQAHTSAFLLLPMIVLGLRRGVRIGARGLYGLLAGAVLASPMVVMNVDVLRQTSGAFHHAGGVGAPYRVALLRATSPELALAQLHGGGSTLAGWAAEASALLLSALAWTGAVLALRRGEPLFRRWMAFGLFLPTLVVPALPRGALYYYLESTASFRCLAMGLAVAWAVEGLRSPRPWVKALAASTALASVGALGWITVDSLVGRFHASDEGMVEIRMDRVDLRHPLGAPPVTVGVPTLSGQQAVGRALASFGVDRGAAMHRLRGPWRFMFADAAWAFSPAYRGFTEPPPIRRPAEGSASILVLHARDSLPAPSCELQRAGAFRVYRFVERCSPPGAEEACEVAPAAGELHFAATYLPGAEPVEIRLAGETSPSHSARGPAGVATVHGRLEPASAPRELSIRWTSDPTMSPMIRMEPELVVYAGCAGDVR